MERPTPDLSLNRISNAMGEGGGGYDLWFNLPSRGDDATTSELQTLCQASILLGRVAEIMGWDWPTLIQNVEHLAAPMDGFVLIEVGSRLFRSTAFRRALQESVPDTGLDPYRVKVMDAENAEVYILGHGSPPF